MLSVNLVDDGTLDTVLECRCDCGAAWTERISQECASQYRSENDGRLYLSLMLTDLGFHCVDCWKEWDDD